MREKYYIGPLIERGGGFAYDTFSQANGKRSSFRYPRIEQARYDRRAMIAELRRDPRVVVHVCETVAEFDRHASGGAPAGEDPPERDAG
jgi:hypothetical protein